MNTMTKIGLGAALSLMIPSAPVMSVEAATSGPPVPACSTRSPAASAPTTTTTPATSRLSCPETSRAAGTRTSIGPGTSACPAASPSKLAASSSWAASMAGPSAASPPPTSSNQSGTPTSPPDTSCGDDASTHSCARAAPRNYAASAATSASPTSWPTAATNTTARPPTLTTGPAQEQCQQPSRDRPLTWQHSTLCSVRRARVGGWLHPLASGSQRTDHRSMTFGSAIQPALAVPRLGLVRCDPRLPTGTSMASLTVPPPGPGRPSVRAHMVCRLPPNAERDRSWQHPST